MTTHTTDSRRRMDKTLVGWVLATFGFLGLASLTMVGLAESEMGPRIVAVLTAPYEHMLEVGLPKEGMEDYLVFHTKENKEDFVKVIQDLLPGAEVKRSTLPQTITVTTPIVDGRELAKLKGLPFVRLAMTNRGFSYCH